MVERSSEFLNRMSVTTKISPSLLIRAPNTLLIEIGREVAAVFVTANCYEWSAKAIMYELQFPADAEVFEI